MARLQTLIAAHLNDAEHPLTPNIPSTTVPVGTATLFREALPSPLWLPSAPLAVLQEAVHPTPRHPAPSTAAGLGPDRLANLIRKLIARMPHAGGCPTITQEGPNEPTNTHGPIQLRSIAGVKGMFTDGMNTEYASSPHPSHPTNDTPP